MTETDSIRQAAELMVECDCGAIPVLSPDGKPIGIITDRDIVVRVIAKGQDLQNATVGDAMTSSVKSVRETDSIEDVRHVMSKNQVRRVPVVDNDAKIVGIVSLADLATDLPHRGDHEVKLAETVQEISETTREHR
jgi:CBS domain-containing protein